MTNLLIDKIKCLVKIRNQHSGSVLLHSVLLGADNLKLALLQGGGNNMAKISLSLNNLELNLGAIPLAQFDSQFNQRLAQAFAQCLAREHVSIGGGKEVNIRIPDIIALKDRPHEYHSGEKELFQWAQGCLQPGTLKSLIQDSPTYQLEHLLKRLLEGVWQCPKMLPPSWYGRVTAARLSLAAMLFLLKNLQEHDWLMHQYAPTQVAGWAKAIARGEIPPEQVVQLLTGNQPFDGISSEQPPFPSLIVMRWLLPLWRQPAVRRVIHRLKGRQGVHRLDAYLSGCLQLQDDVMQAEKGMQSVREQVAVPQDNKALSPGREMESDARQIVLSRDNTMLPECKGIPAASRRTMQPGKDGLRSPDTPPPSGQGISNAGLLLLWPLLPQLFSHLGLWAEAEFVSDAARWQAVYALDRLVRGEGNPTEERLTLNQMLCGVSCSASAPPAAPLSLLQLQQTDDWLTAIGQQLPGWQKLSPADIRQLFLQREGEISTEGTVPQISVWPQPWDFLLRDWPWPMTLASFPWTEQPLTIVWPLNGFTG